MRPYYYLALSLAAAPLQAQTVERAVAAFYIGSVLADCETTFYVLHHCAACQETHDLLVPATRLGRFPVYAQEILLGTGVYLVSEALHNSHGWQHKLWWVLPAGLGLARSNAARKNFNLILRLKL
jgi:hypothetical protein